MILCPNVKRKLITECIEEYNSQGYGPCVFGGNTATIAQFLALRESMNLLVSKIESEIKKSTEGLKS